jgi:hypothetical protein
VSNLSEEERAHLKKYGKLKKTVGVKKEKKYFDSADWQMEGGGPGGAKSGAPAGPGAPAKGGPMRPGMGKNKPPLPAGLKDAPPPASSAAADANGAADDESE